MIRRMKPGEEEDLCLLVIRIFNEFVAPHYSQEGVDEFLRYVDPEQMSKRASRNHFTLLAEDCDNLVGVIEIRDFNHVSLLFVARDAQRQGIARELLSEALVISQREKPNLSEVSVHSSPNAVGAYERLGFQAEGPEKNERGIRFIPMKMLLGNYNDG